MSKRLGGIKGCKYKKKNLTHLDLLSIPHGGKCQNAFGFSYSANWLPTRKTTLHCFCGQSRSWSAEQGKKKKKKEPGSAPPAPTRARCSFGENNIKITRRIYMSRRYAGVGPSRVRTRIPSTHRLGQWVSLSKTLRFRVKFHY